MIFHEFRQDSSWPSPRQGKENTNDCYNNSVGIYKKGGLIVVHFRDIGHLMKSLRKSFSTVKNELYFVKREEHLFYGASQLLFSSYAIFLSSNIHDPIQDVQLWLNCPGQLTGNHENCIHPNQIVKRVRPRKDQKVTFSFWKRGVENPN